MLQPWRLSLHPSDPIPLVMSQMIEILTGLYTDGSESECQTLNDSFIFGFTQSGLPQYSMEGSFREVFVSVNGYNNHFLFIGVIINVMTPIGTAECVAILFQNPDQVFGRIIQCSVRFREYSRVMLSSGIG